MNLIFAFLAGFVVGMGSFLLNHYYFSLNKENIKEIIKEHLPQEKAQFIEPVSFKEKFEQSESLKDLFK